jgi:hypothetical protein
MLAVDGASEVGASGFTEHRSGFRIGHWSPVKDTGVRRRVMRKDWMQKPIDSVYQDGDYDRTTLNEYSVNDVSGTSASERE